MDDIDIIQRIFESLSPESRRVLRIAAAQGTHSQGTIFTEHLLFGLSTIEGGETRAMLHDYSRGDDGLRARLLKKEQWQSTPADISDDELKSRVYSPNMVTVFEHALELLARENTTAVGERHLLFGLLQNGDGRANRWLRNWGIPIDVVRDRLTQSARMQRNGTVIEVVKTRRGWRLPIDALVLPPSVHWDSVGGAFYQALAADLDEELAKNLDGFLERNFPDDLVPSAPQAITLPDDLGWKVLPYARDGQAIIIYATLYHAVDNQNLEELADAMMTGLVRLAARERIRRFALPIIGTGPVMEGPSKPPPERVAGLMLETLLKERSFDGIESISLLTIAQEVLDVAGQTFNRFLNNLTQAFSNDEPTAKDLLGIVDETNALAETLMLREVTPPLAVGIIGSWGSGKSSVMQLIQKKMLDIRTQPVKIGWRIDVTDGAAGRDDREREDSFEPYVGHVYPITFNAWTYAKSDLWASLMHTVFMELNRQLSLEELHTKEQKMQGGVNWMELFTLGEQEWLALNESELGAVAVAQWQTGKADDQLWAIYRKLRATEIAQLEKAEQKRRAKQKALRKLEPALENTLESISEQAKKEVWRQFTQEAFLGPFAAEIQSLLKKHFSEQDLTDLDALFAHLRQLQPTVTGTWKALHQLVTERQGEVIAIGGFVLLALISGLVSDLVDSLANTATVTATMSFVASIGSVAAAAFRTYRQWQERVDQWRASLEGIQAVIAQRLKAEESKLAAEKQAKFYALRQSIEDGLQALDSEIKEHQERIGVTGQFRSLSDFVRSRLKMRDYEARLGLLQRVQADLQELTQALVVREDGKDLHANAKKDFFPRGPARVVLFIDDLDRCPPDKVVEVLEAVQLLLKTQLFVVVLGLDTRYVTRALEKAYRDILQHQGDPSGLDYIEKILQIPYRIRPIEPLGLKLFLRDQMGLMVEENAVSRDEVVRRRRNRLNSVNDHEPGIPDPDDGQDRPDISAPISEVSVLGTQRLTPEVIRLKQDDYDDLYACCCQVNLTPRSVKRLVNVLKLVKVYWFRTLDRDQEQSIKRTVIGFLALSACYPEIMREVFAELDTIFRDKAEAKTLHIGRFLGNEFTLTTTFHSAFAWQLKRFRADVNALRGDVGDGTESTSRFFDLTLEDLGLTTFNLVRSFSFVGDPSYAIERQPGGSVPPTDTLQTSAPPGSVFLADAVWRCPGTTSGASYVGSEQGDRYHSLTCRHVERMSAENRVCFTDRDAAERYGYRSCAVCNP